MKTLDYIELASLNLIGTSVVVWLNNVIEVVPTIVSVMVGISVIALNGIKIYKEINDNSIDK